MTKIRLPHGWVYFHALIDWFDKEIVGYCLSHRSQLQDWLIALDNALNKRYPKGIYSYAKKPKLISDNGCQPTSEAFRKTCKNLDIEQIFTSYNNPKGNADTERFFRTLKEDLIWINEFKTFDELQLNINDWISRYNHDFPHQSLQYLTPNQAYLKYQNSLLNSA